MTQRSPLEFVPFLADASVPAGLEIKELDDVYPQRSPQFAPWTGERVDQHEVIEAFNATHSDYQATSMDGVLVVRPKEGRSEYLDGPSTIQSPVTITGTTAAEGRIFLPLDSALAGPSVGSVLGGMPEAG